MVYFVETKAKKHDSNTRFCSFNLIAHNFEEAVKLAKKHIKLGGNNEETIRSVMQTAATIN